MPSSHRLPVSHDEPQSLMLDMLLGGLGRNNPQLVGKLFSFGYQAILFCCSRRSRFFPCFEISRAVGGSGFSMMLPWLSIFWLNHDDLATYAAQKHGTFPILHLHKKQNMCRNSCQLTPKGKTWANLLRNYFLMFICCMGYELSLLAWKSLLAWAFY